MKLGPHISGYDDKIFDLLEKWQPSIVKVYNSNSEMNIDEIRRRCPGALVVFRQYTNLDYNAPAEAFIAEMDESLRKLSGKGVVWEGINEPQIRTAEDAARLSLWYVRYSRLMHERGEKVAGFSFSTDHPDLRLVPVLGWGALCCDYHAVHEYKNPLNGGNGLLRYRQFRNALPAHVRKPVLITEAGIDDGRDNGWLKYATPDEYLRLLRDYEAELAKDPYVVGATIYQYGDTDPRWRYFDMRAITRALIGL